MGTTFWMSAEIQADVSSQYTAALNEMESALNAVIETSDYGPLTRWSFIAIVREEDHPDYGEVKRYHKKTRVFEFRLKIDHATFKAADDLGKRKLIMAALLRSINEMPKLVPKGIDYARLESDVRGVAASKGWL
jgi:hypothetical protein